MVSFLLLSQLFFVNGVETELDIECVPNYFKARDKTKPIFNVVHTLPSGGGVDLIFRSRLIDKC